MVVATDRKNSWLRTVQRMWLLYSCFEKSYSSDSAGVGPKPAASINWKLARNAESWTPPRFTKSKTLGVEPSNVLISLLGDFDAPKIKFQNYIFR